MHDGLEPMTMKQNLPSLKEIRRAHHLRALLLALGRGANEVAAICGTTTARIEQLSRDPSARKRGTAQILHQLPPLLLPASENTESIN
jgi:hypothetical protein